MNEVIDLLLTRRSGRARDMVGPGPTAEQLETILKAGMRVPDHGKKAPWRFVVFEGEARQKFGEIIAQAFLKANPDTGEESLRFESNRFMRAETVVIVISEIRDTAKVPEWEQVLSAGAVCQNMLLAAHALGLFGQWISEWLAYDISIHQSLDMEDQDRIAGIMYFGQMEKPQAERDRPDFEAKISRWAE
ncbi:nitroreductase [Alphaproteobacteria bacterium]|jgi:nitroreductase|nr:nitroreductase [Alphaproteobacteria bacterium]